MPKPVKKTRKPKLKGKPQGPMTLKELYDLLDKVRVALAQQAEVLHRVTVDLCTVGLADKGPITESDDDIPF